MLFYLGFILCLFCEAWAQSMFPIPPRVYTLVKLVGVALIAVKVLAFDDFSLPSFFLCVLFAADAVLVLISSGYQNVITWIMLIIGAKNISFRKILEMTLVMDISMVLAAFIASSLGVIENLQYTTHSRSLNNIRNSFGIIYPTDFAAFIFFIILIYFYLTRDRLRFYNYIGALVIDALVYYFCGTRLDCLCILFTVIVFAAINATDRIRPTLRDKYRKRHDPIAFCAPFVMPACAALSLLLSALYNPDNSLMKALNTLLSNRLNLGHTGLEEYAITLFGQGVPMFGNGGSTVLPQNYFFIDCSYLHILLRYGLVFFLMLLGVYMFCSYQNRKDHLYVAVILLISINCMVAHHLISFAYNPFPMALFAVMDVAKTPSTLAVPHRGSAKSDLKFT